MASRLLLHANLTSWLARRECRSITTRELPRCGALNARLKVGEFQLQKRMCFRMAMVCKANVEDGESGEEVNAMEEIELEMDKNGEEEPVRKSVVKVALWIMAAVYSLYLFLLPFAPGDPLWAISPATIRGVFNLSFNFFYVLPLANLVGFHLLEAAVVHPVDEAIFNFVLGWMLLFAPLIFTDQKRDRFPGSLDVFWLASMLLTNTFLIPYMALRMNGRPKPPYQQKPTQLQDAFTDGARVVAVTGAAVGLLSIVWFIMGRSAEGYGDLTERWSYWISTVSNDRVSYAFVWDLCCFAVFQPWLVGENLHNIRSEKSRELVGKLRFLPYVGLVAYCWGLDTRRDGKQE